MPSEEKLRTYIFVRDRHFYPVQIPPSQLQANIDLNPGTIRVEDTGGNIVWEATKQ